MGHSLPLIAALEHIRHPPKAFSSSSSQMDAEAARQKARARKAEALGMEPHG